MSHRRLLLILVAGGLVVAAPFLAGLRGPHDVAPINVMATLTEAREALDEKRERLTEIARSKETSNRHTVDATIQVQSAREIHALTHRFLHLARSRFSHLSVFLSNIRDRIDSDMADIEATFARIGGTRSPHALHPDGPRRPSPLAAGSPGLLHDPPPRIATGHTAGAPAPASGTPIPVDAGVAAPPGATSPPPSELLKRYQRAVQLFMRGSAEELDESIEAFRRLQASGHRFALLRMWLAKALKQRRRLEEASREAEQLVAEQPHLRTAWHLLEAIRRQMRPHETHADHHDSAPANPSSPPHGSLATSLDGPRIPALPIVGAPTGRDRQGDARSGGSTDEPGSIAPPLAPPSRADRRVEPLRRRDAHAVGVVIDVNASAWPPRGLDRADLFYEVRVQGGHSRILAVFREPPPGEVGPVRGAFPALLEAARGLGVWIVHSGVHPPRLGRDPRSIDAAKRGEGFRRDPSASAPHNLFVDLKTIVRGLGRPPAATGPGSAGWRAFPRLAEPPKVGGEGWPTLRTLAVPIGQGDRALFRHDVESGTYRRMVRSGSGAPADGEPTFASILVLTDPDGSGRHCRVHIGTSLQEGRLALDATPPLTDAEGLPILLAPGPVWIVDTRSAEPVGEVAVRGPVRRAGQHPPKAP